MSQPQNSLLSKLASQKIGIICGFATVLLLAIGAGMIPSPRSEDALPFSESIRPFFAPIAWKHSWFYLLLIVLTIYGVNLTAATIDHILTRKRHGSASGLRFYGVVLMHIGTLGGLAAHLVAGLTADGQGVYLVGSQSQQIEDQIVALQQIDRTFNGDGSLRTLRASLVFEDGRERALGYNEPIFFDGYRRFWLLQGQRPAGNKARIRLPDGSEHVLGMGDSAATETTRYLVQKIAISRSLRFPMIAVVAQPITGATNVEGVLAQEEKLIQHEDLQWLKLGGTDDNGLSFVGVEEEQGVVLASRRNDGLPWLMLAMSLLCLGVALYFGAIVKQT